MQRILLSMELPDNSIKKLEGDHVDARHYDILVKGDGDVEVVKPNGKTLLKVLRNVIPQGAHDSAWPVIARAYAKGSVLNRKTAAGRNPDKKGSSVTIGFLDRSARFGKRPTRKAPFDFTGALAYISEVNEQYRRHMPDHHAHQQFAASFSHWVIESMEECEATAFSSVTVNQNWQTAVHRDSGNFKGSFGVMTCFRTNNYSGGELIFPKYRCAVDYGNRDVLLADVHECHGNAPMVGDGKEFTRISCVLYLRDRIVKGGTKKQEAEFIRNHKKGEPFLDVWILNGRAVPDDAPVPIDERVALETDELAPK
jgi:hypothetical protein